MVAVADASRVIGVGIDIADAARFDRLLSGRPSGSWRRWFTVEERLACARHRRPGRAAATRFAVKEATFKALGANLSGPDSWRDIEVLGGDDTYTVHLSGEIALAAVAVGATDFHVSICLEGARVLATVIAERRRFL